MNEEAKPNEEVAPESSTSAEISADEKPSSTVAAENATEDNAGASTEDKIVTMLKTVYDPEIPVDIHELGLIYAVDLNAEGVAAIRMTLTSPNCPAAESLPSEVETKVKTVEGVTDAKVEIVWDPPWTPDLMSEAAKLELGMW